ncbi:hypothetical protein CDL12_19764 [Handroanthus impetiginosus]|uniref:Ionotropic glutamate receptor C-terminal domain-containing protein n=1 Tax=Handroanthus impetiginosus TaxID=429701 RepID=A0A2G9GQX2_9LAMI|nr:hypothetical protein CDL12_19764 [Handroanthus impetiginosus]
MDPDNRSSSEYSSKRRTLYDQGSMKNPSPKFFCLHLLVFMSFCVSEQRVQRATSQANWIEILVLFLNTCLCTYYTANLTSMLTVQQLQPTITSMHDLIKNGEYVGYQEGSFVSGFLNNTKFDSSKTIGYSSFKQYDEALSKGSRNGGVAAVVEVLPFIRLFLTKYCHKYTRVAPTYSTAGFGFAFQKGSPLVPDVSKAILNMAEGEKIERIKRQWFGEEEGCPDSHGTKSLTLDSFRGLFLIAGLSSSSALVIFLSKFFYQNRAILASDASIKQRLSALAKVFDEERDTSSSAAAAADESTTPEEITDSAQSPISISYQNEGMFSQDEGFSTTEPGTPVHHATEC